MKRSVLVTLMMFILAGCSGLPVSIPFLQTPVVAPPQPTATPYALQTLAPSNTPDLFVINTAGLTASPGSGMPLVTDFIYPLSESLPQRAEKYQPARLGRHLCRGSLDPLCDPGSAGKKTEVCDAVVPSAG